MAILATFLRPAFSASGVPHISDMHSKFALRPHHVWNMVDIQSAAAEIRRGKKREERRKKPQGKNIVSAYAAQGGHNEPAVCDSIMWYVIGRTWEPTHWKSWTNWWSVRSPLYSLTLKPSSASV